MELRILGPLEVVDQDHRVRFGSLEQRTLLGDRIDLRLALGQHAELVGELEALIASHPLQEQPRAPTDARPVPGGSAKTPTWTPERG